MQAETSYPAIVGKLLENLRKERNLKQQDVAGMLGLTQSAWSRIERGQSGLSMELLVRVCDLLETRPHEVLADADKARTGLIAQGIKVHPHVIARPERMMAVLGLAALGMMIFAILGRK
ncbi:MAG: helix-turn-helix transcriptional regulator [Rhodospirillales bacterium]|nr:helix-turn-helix transcriptional regulator [Alphaproteobacteria bacterium]MCB1839492.1 helix-turn-helix transcriptional regulator [Alphaproteobacteria bacterium]MCB9977512.1 helix-turn-helix transcriptional regulator [Rhodospirillales bacterium]